MKKSLLFISAVLSLCFVSSCGETEVHTHKYDAPTFDWSKFDLEKNSGSVYADFKCNSCDYKLVKEAHIDVEINESCTEEQHKKYTATFVSLELGGPYSDVKEIKSSTITGHNLTKIEACEPTCQRNGNILFYSCSNCHKNFTDESCTKEVGDVSLPKLDHEMIKYDAREKTCEQDGYIDHYHCSRCNLDFRDKEGNIPVSNAVIKKGHELTEYPYQAPTCCEEGTLHYYECGICKKKFDSIEATTIITEVKIPRIGPNTVKHDAVNATCFEKGSIEYYECDNCYKKYIDKEAIIAAGDIETPLKEHNWGASTGECKWCNSINFITAHVAKRSAGTTVSIENPIDMPEEFKHCYKSTGDLGGGVNTNRYFKSSDISEYKEIKFAIKTFCNPNNGEHLYLKTWDSATEVLASDGWVNVFAKRKGTTNTFDITLSNGKEYTMADKTTLYDLFPFHYANSLYADVYITEVIGLKSSQHVHHFGELVKGTPSTCLVEGIIDHYQCSDCKKYFDKDYNPVDSLVDPKKQHNFVNYACTNCSCKLVDYSSNLYSPSTLIKTQGTAPTGFKDVYSYDAMCGGGQTDCFFKHTTSNPLSGVKKMEFAFLTSRVGFYRILFKSTSGPTWVRIPYQSYGAADDWVFITMTRENPSNGTWHISSNKPDGGSSGEALNTDVTINETDYINDLWGCCLIVNQNPSSPTEFYNITITEIILSY